MHELLKNALSIMGEKFGFIMVAVFLDGLAGLCGGLLPLAFVQRHLTTLLAFASGTLIGTAFFELLPEAFHSGEPTQQILLATAAGFAIFYVVQSFLGSHATGQGGHKHHAVGPLILIGDALHNITDGVAIAAAFMAGTHTGIATTFAVIVHEVPQEIGDYAILVAHGYSRKKALLCLIVVQLAALLGALVTYFAAANVAAISPFLMAISAGGFIYIAAADLLPELQRRKARGGPLAKLASLCMGLLTIGILKTLFHV